MGLVGSSAGRRFVMLFKVYLLVVLITSVVSFVLYGWDKRQAKVDGRRIPENNLHVLAFVGGWPGAFLGQQVFRHKTQKRPFQIKYWLIVVAHVAIVVGVWFLLR